MKFDPGAQAEEMVRGVGEFHELRRVGHPVPDGPHENRVRNRELVVGPGVIEREVSNPLGFHLAGGAVVRRFIETTTFRKHQATSFYEHS